jgi:hypothetical protein
MIKLLYISISTSLGRLNLRCTEGHAPEDGLLVNEKGLPDGLLVFLRIRFSGRGKSFDIDGIIIQMLLVMLENSCHVGEMKVTRKTIPSGAGRPVDLCFGQQGLRYTLSANSGH